MVELGQIPRVFFACWGCVGVILQNQVLKSDYHILLTEKHIKENKMKKILAMAAIGVSLCCLVAGASGLSMNDAQRLARLANRTSYSISSNGARVEAKCALPKTVKLINIGQRRQAVAQSDDATVVTDTTKTVLCHLDYDSFGRLVKCVREASNETWGDKTFTGLTDTLAFEYNDAGLVSSVDYMTYDVDFYNDTVNRHVGKMQFSYSEDGRLLSISDFVEHYNGEWNKEQLAIEVGKYADLPTVSIFDASSSQDNGVTANHKMFSVMETDANGAPKKVSYLYAKLIGSGTNLKKIADFVDIKWNKFTTFDEFNGMDLTTTHMGFINDDDCPLGLFLNYLNTDKNDVASFKVVLADDGEADTISVVASHEGNGLRYDIGYGKENLTYKYVPIDDKGSFDFITLEGENDEHPTCESYREVSQLPDYLYKLTGVDIANFEDFDLLQQGQNLLTGRSAHAYVFDSNAMRRFETSYEDDEIKFTQIAECSDFVGYSAVAEIDDNAEWKAVGGKGTISISGADGKQLAVYAMSGRLVYASAAASDVSIEAQPGVYVVRVADKCKKVAVR